MQITAVFESMEEVIEFSKRMLGNSVSQENSDVNPVQTEDSVKESVQVPGPQPVTYGQQIAHPFPAANTEQAKVEPEASVPQQTQTVSQPAIRTTAPSYTLGDLSGAAMQLMDKGMQDQLQQLLTGYGVETLPALPLEQFGNFATALRGMGAQI